MPTGNNAPPVTYILFIAVPIPTRSGRTFGHCNFLMAMGSKKKLTGAW